MDRLVKISRKVEDLDTNGVVELLERWGMEEFVEFARKKQLDGRKLLDVSEGIVKLWRPKSNTKRFMHFIKDLKESPNKYFEITETVLETDTLNVRDSNVQELAETERNDDENVVITETKDENDTTFQNKDTSPTNKMDIECQYQTVTVRKKIQNTNTTSHNTMSSVEELIKKLVPAKSFLYRNQQKTQGTPSYLPMDAGTPKKSRKLFRLSSYEYPFFDIRARFSRQDSSNDRGYYSMKRNSRYYIQKMYKKPESKPKYKSISTAEELTKYPEDHFYEDLNYIDIEKDKNEEKPNEPVKIPENRVVAVKPCMVKIQELFQSFKVPFFRKHEMVEDTEKRVDIEKEVHIYENSDSITTSNMYDSVRVNREGSEEKKQTKTQVEDYLEPVQVHRDYCDVSYTNRQKDDSLLGYIMSIFENRFGIRRETNDADISDSSETESHRVECTLTDEAGRKWPDKPSRPNMADRPLPVPVENEPYYMNIDRGEAENLLRGQPDGTFVLRPSSQANHAYTLTVSCANAVHNVGVRRRPDGRLALGFARRGERSFASVTSLLRHHRKRRLLLVAAGGVIGGTTLNETPHYYQTPSSIPLPI